MWGCAVGPLAWAVAVVLWQAPSLLLHSCCCCFERLPVCVCVLQVTASLRCCTAWLACCVHPAHGGRTAPHPSGAARPHPAAMIACNLALPCPQASLSAHSRHVRWAEGRGACPWKVWSHICQTILSGRARRAMSHPSPPLLLRLLSAAERCAQVAEGLNLRPAGSMAAPAGVSHGGWYRMRCMCVPASAVGC